MSHRFRLAAATLLAPTGLLRNWRRRFPGEDGRVVLIGHHRVAPLQDEAAHRGDVELISGTPEQFAWQVDYLARHFEPVSCRQIADALDGRASLPRRAVAITFDDGYADLMEYALPILRAAHVPATVFVATDYVATREPFWFDLVAQVMRLAPVGSIRLPPIANDMPEADSPRARASTVHLVLKRLKNCSDAERLAFLDALSSGYPDLVNAAKEGLGRALTWEQMREMVAGGIEIGAHSATHPCLAQLDAGKLRCELVEPKREIEAQLGMECPSLAYPFGGRRSYSDDVVRMAAEVGYRVGVSYIPGVNVLARAGRFELLRQHVERYTSRSYFEAVTNLPEYFG